MDTRICVAFPCFNPTPEQWVALAAFIERTKRAVDARISFVVVDDGSPRWISPPNSLESDVRLLRASRNLGKGGALKLAIESMPSDCEVFAFTDFDLPYSTDDLVGVCSAVVSGADVCIADRTSYFSRAGSDRLSRGAAHRLFRLFTRTLIAGGIADSQSGLKAFDARAVRLIARRSSLNSFLFDVEWLYIALRHQLAVRSWPAQVSDAHASGRLRSMNYKRLWIDLFRLLRRILKRDYDAPELVEWLKARLSGFTRRPENP